MHPCSFDAIEGKCFYDIEADCTKGRQEIGIGKPWCLQESGGFCVSTTAQCVEAFC
jgi:hypothetical protein